MLTDKDIIKALECCISNTKDCSECVFLGTEIKENTTCEVKMMKNALDLINRLQAENERLKEQIKVDDKIYEDTCNRLDKELATAKSNAIKEFAEDVEYEILHKEYWKDHPYTSQVWLNGYEQCMRDMRVMLKDKVKEMVGEE